MVPESESAQPLSPRLPDTLDAGARFRLERDWALQMNERLALMQAVCKQVTAIAGAARRR